VPSAQVPAIQAGARVRIEIPSLARWVEVKGVTVVPSADPRTHTTQVRLDLPADAKGLLPGVFARAYFVTGRAPRLMVPRESVIHRSEVTAVYVVEGQGAPRLRQVRLGTASDDRGIEVLAGLKPGEKVALEPIKAGMAAAPAN
jgi:multidrug efflux pump subunit AcrA (membrane-fusion protein)